MIDGFISEMFNEALKKIGVNGEIALSFEIPKIAEHGDLSTNIAMKLAKVLKKSPQKIAKDIISNIEYNKELIEKIDIAGPGFINIKFTDRYYINGLKNLVGKKENIGKSGIGGGKKVNVEYVSCNPTGLLHLGHGRNAALGDTISNLLDWLGYDVTREYYFNNAGGQMTKLAKSIYARYMQKLQNSDFPFPDDGYYGEYIKDIANEIIEKFGDKYINGSDEDLNELKKYGENWSFNIIKKTLDRMNVHQDVFYNESSLYEEGKIDEIINLLKSKDIAYEKDGALWLALTKLGMKDDRVIVKSSGEPTYRLPDIAYHREKFERGFDIIIDVFGADHIATVPDVKAGVKALGYDVDKIKVVIYQFVTLTENGEKVKMSKRSGRSYTLDELLDEVGSDVVRFFLLMRGANTHLEFDLSLAKEQSEKNPVFYLQYAHARICSIFEKAKESNLSLENQSINYQILQDKSELDLIKEILRFEDIVQLAGEKYEPQILADYLRGLAASFHLFYHNCRIIGVEQELSLARLKLAETCMIVMKNGLTILGISAPEKM